ncbi:MAG: sugar transferase [Actinomycetota bacterium]|nr:sugar transferase [Actinomycetota bacterium]
MAYQELTVAPEAIEVAEERSPGHAWITGAAREPLLRRMLATGDALAVCLTISALAFLERGSLVAAAPLLAVFPLWILLAKLHGLYDRDRHALRHLSVDEVPEIFGWAMSGTVATMLLLIVLPVREVTLKTALVAWLLTGAFAFCFRSTFRWLWRALTATDRVFVLGEDPLAEAVTRKLALFPDIHAELVGLRSAWEVEPSDYAEAFEGVDRIILASRVTDESMIAPLLAYCRQQDVRLTVVPPTRAMFGTAAQLSHVADLPVVEFNTGDASRSTLLLKRGFDVAASGLALLILSPLFLVIAIAIRLNTRGPAMFTQARGGRDGVPFTMYKFRTMVVQAEDMLADLVSFDHLKEPVFKIRDDPRVTRVGRLLRRTSLDELPQLINIFKGDMSIVGPRPEQFDLVERYSETERFRLSVKPGLTGPMQVYGRGHLSLEERLAVEREYIENLSLGRDLRIIAMTFSPLVSGKGAF